MAARRIRGHVVSQVARVLAALEEGEWVCAKWMYASGLPNGRNRVGELRRAGYHITSEPCPDSHGPAYFRYRLLHGPSTKCIDCYQMRMAI